MEGSSNIWVIFYINFISKLQQGLDENHNLLQRISKSRVWVFLFKSTDMMNLLCMSSLGWLITGANASPNKVQPGPDASQLQGFGMFSGHSGKAQPFLWYFISAPVFCVIIRDVPGVSRCLHNGVTVGNALNTQTHFKSASSHSHPVSLLLHLTWNRTLLPATICPCTTSWWPLCHLKKSRLVASSGKQALWSLIRSLLTKRQWLPECKVAYSKKGSSSELMERVGENENE